MLSIHLQDKPGVRAGCSAASLPAISADHLVQHVLEDIAVLHDDGEVPVRIGHQIEAPQWIAVHQDEVGIGTFLHHAEQTEL